MCVCMYVCLCLYKRSFQKKSSHCYYNENCLHDVDIAWQPRGVDWEAHAWTMMTSLYQLVGAVDALEWARVLCGYCIQNDWVSSESAKFCVKLEHSSVETIQMIQKATAMGNWWLAASSQHAHSCIMSHAEILVKHLITQWFRPSTVQVWCPLTSGFSQT